MLVSDCRSVAQPRTYDVRRVLLFQLCLSAGAAILKRLRRCFHTRTADDLSTRRTGMLIRIAAKHRDNPRLAVRGKRVSLVEEAPKFGNLGTIRDPLPYRLVFFGGGLRFGTGPPNTQVSS